MVLPNLIVLNEKSQEKWGDVVCAIVIIFCSGVWKCNVYAGLKIHFHMRPSVQQCALLIELQKSISLYLSFGQGKDKMLPVSSYFHL